MLNVKDIYHQNSLEIITFILFFFFLSLTRSYLGTQQRLPTIWQTLLLSSPENLLLWSSGLFTLDVSQREVNTPAKMNPYVSSHFRRDLFPHFHLL